MSKEKTPIVCKRAENLKILMQRENLTQVSLSEMICYRQQHISRIINLVQPMTESFANRVIDVFPKYRLSWLLGFSEYATHTEYINGVEKKEEAQRKQAENAIGFLADKSGFSISLYSDFGEAEYLVTFKEKTGYIFRSQLDGIIKDLSALLVSELSRTIHDCSIPDQILDKKEGEDNETC